MEQLPSNKIVWLASYPKSGNTWLRIFLNSIIHPDDNNLFINNLSITAGIISNRFLFDKWICHDSSELTKDEIDNLLPLVIKKRAESFEERSFIKTHNGYFKNKNGKFLIPYEATKKVIYVVRNPFDVCVSLAFHSGHIDFARSIKYLNNKNSVLAYDPNSFNVQLHQYLGDWSMHYESWKNNFPPEKLLVVRYEDMNLNGISTFAKIVDFLNIEISKENLVQCIEKCSFKNLQNQEKKEGFTEKPVGVKRFFRKGKVGGWTDYLTNEQEQEIVEKHSKVMKELNYLDKNNNLIIC
jgi:hypothetical protein